MPDEITESDQTSTHGQNGGLRQRPGDQPLPVTADPAAPGMHDKAIALLSERKALGLSRYGTTLQPFNGRDALRDAVEEVTDLLVYLLQVREERDAPRDAVLAELRAVVQALGGDPSTLHEPGDVVSAVLRRVQDAEQERDEATRGALQSAKLVLDGAFGANWQPMAEFTPDVLADGVRRLAAERDDLARQHQDTLRVLTNTRAELTSVRVQRDERDQLIPALDEQLTHTRQELQAERTASAADRVASRRQITEIRSALATVLGEAVADPFAAIERIGALRNLAGARADADRSTLLAVVQALRDAGLLGDGDESVANAVRRLAAQRDDLAQQLRRHTGPPPETLTVRAIAEREAQNADPAREVTGP